MAALSSESASSGHHHGPQTAITSSTKQDMLEYVVTKRVKNLNYIRRIHEGKAYWLNVVRITPEDIVRYYHPQTLQKRVQQWFYMGVSIAPLLQLDSGWQFVRACAQLMEEFEYHFSNVAVQGMKMLRALTISTTDEEQTRSIRPTINKVGGNVVYEFLRTPNIPCELDYCQVVFSLCDILTFVYRKLLDDSISASTLHESIVKLDGRFKHHFFGLISRDLNTLSMYTIKNKISTLEAFMSGKDSQALFSAEAKLDLDKPIITDQAVPEEFEEGDTAEEQLEAVEERDGGEWLDNENE